MSASPNKLLCAIPDKYEHLKVIKPTLFQYILFLNKFLLHNTYNYSMLENMRKTQWNKKVENKITHILSPKAVILNLWAVGQHQSC